MGVGGDGTIDSVGDMIWSIIIVPNHVMWLSTRDVGNLREFKTCCQKKKKRAQDLLKGQERSIDHYRRLPLRQQTVPQRWSFFEPSSGYSYGAKQLSGLD